MYHHNCLVPEGHVIMDLISFPSPCISVSHTQTLTHKVRACGKLLAVNLTALEICQTKRLPPDVKCISINGP